MAQSFLDRAKRSFRAGLIALLPTLLTIVVIAVCIEAVNDYVATPLQSGFRALLRTDLARSWYWGGLLGLEEWQLTDAPLPPPGAVEPDLRGFAERVDAHVPKWVGFLLGLVLVALAGAALRNYVGRKLLRALERLLARLPVIRLIFPSAKQVTEFFFAGRRTAQFERAVAIPYPRAGVYSLGFITNESFRVLPASAGADMIVVFIPSSPMPFTGWTVMVPRADLIPLDLSIDEALRFMVSGGVLVPGNGGTSRADTGAIPAISPPRKGEKR